MVEEIEIENKGTLELAESIAGLQEAAHQLRSNAAALAPVLRSRRVWMVNSTAKGGGVAEMMPKLVSLLREVGVDAHWLVMHTDQHAFFSLTKRLHNLIHGSGDPALGAEDSRQYEVVSRQVADALEPRLTPDDILVVHDPQPAGAGAIVKERIGLTSVWRCHIGLDETNAQTQAAWSFLEPHLVPYDHSVFSAPEYIPPYLSGRASIIHPALDPLGHKNRLLSTIKQTGILTNAGLVVEHAPVLTPAFPAPVKRLQPDGTFGAANSPDEIGLLFRPVVTQVSRWDYLKGWLPLLEGFLQMKSLVERGSFALSEREYRRVEICRLILAGPEPAAVQDDPEARGMLEELCRRYARLSPREQQAVVILSLPMASTKLNALIVNALQRASSVVVQNSIREGFGLVVTEAMWKRTPVLGSSACGIRQQIRDGVDGLLIPDPKDPACVADRLNTMLANVYRRNEMARMAERRVHDEFLVFRQVSKWLSLLSGVSTRASFPPKRGL